MKKLIIALVVLGGLGYGLNAYDISSGKTYVEWATVHNMHEPGTVLVELNESYEKRTFEIPEEYWEEAHSGAVHKVSYTIGGLSKKRRNYEFILN